MMVSNRSRVRVTCCYGLALSVLALGGQAATAQVFDPVDKKDVTEDAALAFLKRNTGVLRSTYVKVNQKDLSNPLFSVQPGADRKHADARIKVRLFDNLTIELKRGKVSRSKEGALLWSTDVPLFPGSKAHISFSGDLAFGSIIIGNRAYVIRPVNGNVLRIQEIDLRALPQEAEPVGEIFPNRQRLQGFEGLAELTSPVTIKVLIILPIFPSTCETMPWFLSSIKNQAEDTLNFAFGGVFGNQISASVDVVCVTYSPVSGNISADLTWVRTDPEVAALRNSHASDLVSLLIFSDAGYCGIGYYNAPPIVPTDASLAFSVVRESCAFENYTLAHELGHNMGMHHDRAAGGDWKSSACNFGYIFQVHSFVTYSMRTIMAYGSSCGGCGRIGSYSVPEIWGLLGPMGVDCTAPQLPNGDYDRANNTSQLIQAAPVVAGFR